MPGDTPHFPGRPLIDAYGNGGFRFADMSHRGSILILPSGVYAWNVARFGDLDEAHLAPILAEAEAIEILLIGSGNLPAVLAEPLKAKLRAQGIGTEVMDTGAAARTYNVLLAENRAVAAALIAVD